MRLRVGLLVVAALMLTAVGLLAGESFEEKQLSRQATKALYEIQSNYADEDYDTAIDKLYDLLARGAVCPEVFYNLALCYYTRNGDIDCIFARDYYNYFLVMSPDSPAAPEVQRRLDSLRIETAMVAADGASYRELASATLAELARRPVGMVSAQAVAILAQRGDPEAVVQLESRMAGAPPTLAFTIARIFAESGRPEATASLVKIARNPSRPERREAVELLASLPQTAETAAALAELVVDQDREVRGAAARVLLARGDRDAADILKKLLETASPVEGCTMAAVLAKAGEDEGREYLQKSLVSKNAYVKVVAAGVLMRLGDEDARKVLEESAGGTLSGTRYVAKVALWQAGDGSTAKAFEAAVTGAEGPEKAEAIEIIAEYPRGENIDLMIKAFVGAEGEMQIAIAEELAAMGESSVLGFLADRMVNSSWSTRIKAARAMLRYYDAEAAGDAV